MPTRASALRMRDKLGNNFSFEVIIDNSVGYADIYLELEF
jgi:hypothetical protein